MKEAWGQSPRNILLTTPSRLSEKAGITISPFLSILSFLEKKIKTGAEMLDPSLMLKSVSLD